MSRKLKVDGRYAEGAPDIKFLPPSLRQVDVKRCNTCRFYETLPDGGGQCLCEDNYIGRPTQSYQLEMVEPDEVCDNHEEGT